MPTENPPFGKFEHRCCRGPGAQWLFADGVRQGLWDPDESLVRCLAPRTACARLYFIVLEPNTVKKDEGPRFVGNTPPLSLAPAKFDFQFT